MRGSARHPKEICRARPEVADRRLLLLHVPVLAPDFEIIHSGADVDEEASSERRRPSVRAHLAANPDVFRSACCVESPDDELVEAEFLFGCFEG